MMLDIFPWRKSVKACSHVAVQRFHSPTTTYIRTFRHHARSEFSYNLLVSIGVDSSGLPGISVLDLSDYPDNQCRVLRLRFHWGFSIFLFLIISQQVTRFDKILFPPFRVSLLYGSPFCLLVLHHLLACVSVIIFFFSKSWKSSII